MIRKVVRAINEGFRWCVALDCGHAIYLPPHLHNVGIAGRVCGCCKTQKMLDAGGGFDDLLREIFAPPDPA